jgi:Zn-finger nucleic acid-binding protein
MICPNENIEMHLVKIESHYGTPILLDQCEKCGGIWFDQSELYRARQGEAEKIELLDPEILATPSSIESTKLFCPRDRTELIRFTDKYFPQGIIIERCPVCDGFWLNRGEFTKYQKARQELQHSKEITAADAKLSEELQRILAAHQSGSTVDTLARLDNFLSTPVDNLTLRPEESTGSTPEEVHALDIALSVLTAVLNALITRRIF